MKCDQIHANFLASPVHISTNETAVSLRLPAHEQEKEMNRKLEIYKCLRSKEDRESYLNKGRDKIVGVIFE